MNGVNAVRVQYPILLRDIMGGEANVRTLLQRLGLIKKDGWAGPAELMTRTYQQIDGVAVRFTLDRDGTVRLKGNLAARGSNSAEAGLDMGSSGTLSLWSAIPETILIGAVGLELTAVVSHRWFRHEPPIINSTWSKNGLVLIGFDTPLAEVGSDAIT